MELQILSQKFRIKRCLPASCQYDLSNVAFDQPFMSKWLTRLRKDLQRSGSITELSLHLAKNSSHRISPEEWKLSIRAILDDEQKPDSDFVLAVDQWISQRNLTPSPKSITHSDQLDLL